MLFRSYIGSCLPSGEQLHVVEASDEDTHVRYTVSRQAQGKACNKNTTCLRATSHEWIYVRAPARASKMANQCAKYGPTRLLYLCKEPFLQKKHLLFQAIAALRRFVGLGRFVTVWKNGTGHSHTHTHTQPL